MAPQNGSFKGPFKETGSFKDPLLHSGQRFEDETLNALNPKPSTTS